MAQPPGPNSGQLGKAFPASELPVGSAEASLWLHQSPTSYISVLLPPFPQVLVLRALLKLVLSAHQSPSECFLGKTITNTLIVTSFQNILEYLRLRVFLTSVSGLPGPRLFSNASLSHYPLCCWSFPETLQHCFLPAGGSLEHSMQGRLHYVFYSLTIAPTPGNMDILELLKHCRQWKLLQLNMIKPIVQRREAQNVKLLIGGPSWTYPGSLFF